MTDKKIVALKTDTGFAPDNKAIATQLRDLADVFEKDDFDAVNNLIIVVDYADGSIGRLSCGKPMTLPHLIGLLTITAVEDTMAGSSLLREG